MIFRANLPTLVPPNFCTTQLLWACAVTGKFESRIVVAIVQAKISKDSVQCNARNAQVRSDFGGEAGESGDHWGRFGLHIFFFCDSIGNRVMQIKTACLFRPGTNDVGGPANHAIFI